jgi:rhodanese-related sulfurtransferase
MRSTVRKLSLEMAAIVLVAAAVGVIWNHGMLHGVWTGTPGGASTSSSVSANQGGIPLPAGLMQVKEMYDRKEAVFVDARDELSFARGHIKGAVSLPVGKFEAKSADFTGKVPVKAAIVVYCNGYGCHDSMTVGKKLMSKGYSQVFVFEGGYPEWKDGKLPVERQNP